MFSRQKPQAPKKRNHNLAQFGLTEIPDNFDPSAGFGLDDDDVHDSDLEAELNALTSGANPKPKAKPKAKASIMPTSDLDKMIADSLRDVSSDEDEDNDVDDEELMGELKHITGNDADVEPKENTTAEEQPIYLPTSSMDIVAIIKQRLELYKLAESQAQATGEAAKARRLKRGLKALEELLKKATAGQTVAVDDIPPEVCVKVMNTPEPSKTEATPSPTKDEPPKVPKRAAPPPPAPAEEVSSEPPAFPPPIHAVETAGETANPLLEQMSARQREYKAAALQAKRGGDTAAALQYLKVVKQFDMVMKMCADGQQVDISDMPPPPEEFAAFMVKMQGGGGGVGVSGEESETAAAEATPAPPTQVAASEGITSKPTSILEALVERLEKYKSVEQAAKAENNTSKARRYGRIVKQYEDAIKQHKAGRPVAFDELPIPPGFGPLPTTAPESTSTTSPEPPTTTTNSASTSPSTESTPTGTPQPAKRVNRVSPRTELTTRTSGNQQHNNLAEQQMKILLDRQREFKLAAIEAKKTGEIEQAKEYLKIYKGFDALLNAASSGLPVDLNTLPVPPSQKESLEASFAIVDADECDPNSDDISDIGVRIEEQLAKQLMMCKNTRDHHKAMGDIAGMNRFENLALTVQKDLDLVRYSKRQNLPLPKFHYEKRSFNIVHCNTDLRDDELEIVVVRGINYSVANPKEVDTYVKVEFPLLNEEVFRAKTNLIKDTNNPDYDQHFTVEIQRGNRQFQRIFKRHGVKLEVYSRGGFLRSDILIGTVTVKLQPLETKCDIHDTYDLMEGRRAVGGKLELKLRVRNPILTKQMEHINEKWLVLDS